jgi:hypothetical protein
MDELRESSLLFSLESLLETERERVQREAREAQERREHELKRVAELAERRRLATQQEREARERRQALEQERERLEQERIDAMKRATVERARIEAESNARIVELEQAQKHDLALSKLREHESSARYRALFWLSSAAFAVTLGLSLSGFFGFVRPAHAREQQNLQALVAATEARVTATERALSAERSKNQVLEERVKQLQAAAAQPKPAKPEPQAGPGRPLLHGPGLIKEPIRKPCGRDGDPLDPCLR